MCGESKVIATFITWIVTRWRWMISLMRRPPYPRERAPDIYQTGSLVGPRPGLGVWEKKKICSSQSLISNYVKGNMRWVVWSYLPPFVPNNREEARNFFVKFAGIFFEIWTKEILNMTAGMLSIRCLSEFRNRMLDEAWLWPAKRSATRQTWSTLSDRKIHDNLRGVWFRPRPWQVSVKYDMFPFIECTWNFEQRRRV